MPELPEVETTARQLAPHLRNRTIRSVWWQWPSLARYPRERMDLIARRLKNQKITDVTRRAKYVRIVFKSGQELWIHQKMTGHLLVGHWKHVDSKWQSQDKDLEIVASSRFLRLVIGLDNNKQLALSDSRRFGRIWLLQPGEAETLPDLAKLGPEPLTLDRQAFVKIFAKRRGFLKPVLMNPLILAGVGNIYADEALWRAGLHPRSRVEHLRPTDWAKLHTALIQILKLAIERGGSSVNTYRTPDGSRGGYQDLHQAYQRTGQICRRCGAKIKRIILAGRSTHFCPKHQRLL